MSTTDTIADMLTRLRNALEARHDTVLVPASKIRIAIAKILKEEGYIKDYAIVKSVTPQPMIKVYLRYGGGGEPAIVGLKRVSKPGLRVYVGKSELSRQYKGLGLTILSTSQGLLTGRDAWRKGVGGELLCYLW